MAVAEVFIDDTLTPIDNTDCNFESVLAKHNLLLDKAATLLAVMSLLKQDDHEIDLFMLQNKIVDEIKQFDLALKHLGYQPQIALQATYCLCAVIDEFVLKRSSKISNIWAKNGLTSIFFQDSLSGERFYTIIGNVLKDPHRNIAVAELCYVLLCLGYEGKYYHNPMKRIEIRDSLKRVIVSIRKPIPLELYLRDQTAVNTAGPKTKSISRFTLITFCFFGLFIAAITFHSLYSSNHLRILIKQINEMEL